MLIQIQRRLKAIDPREDPFILPDQHKAAAARAKPGAGHDPGEGAEPCALTSWVKRKVVPPGPGHSSLLPGNSVTAVGLFPCLEHVGGTVVESVAGCNQRANTA